MRVVHGILREMSEVGRTRGQGVTSGGDKHDDKTGEGHTDGPTHNSETTGFNR